LGTAIRKKRLSSSVRSMTWD